ncbi:unnamed protein product [Heterobilharzia americana]|nr:unnamed protein product [Heterobilharzia americana]
MGCTPVDLKGLNMNLKGPSLKLRCDSNFNYSDVDLIQNIYTHIRQKHELPRPYNPLNPESTKASDASQKNTYRFATGSLRSTVGRHLKRNTCSAYGSLRHTSSSLTGSSNNIDSDDFTDPPTPTNELNEEKQQN